MACLLCHCRKRDGSESASPVDFYTAGRSAQVFVDDWDMVPHTVRWYDMASFLFGEEPTWVLAGAHLGNTHGYEHPGKDGSAVFAQYEKRSQGIFVSGPSNPHAREIFVPGPRGMMTMGEQSYESSVDR